jgi:formylglycine-generating enzyme required for sulfatase activity
MLNMTDNVSEWTASFACSYADQSCTKQRIRRGGDVSGHAAGMRAAYRIDGLEEGEAPRIGLRCASPLM